MCCGDVMVMVDGGRWHGVLAWRMVGWVGGSVGWKVSLACLNTVM